MFTYDLFYFNFVRVRNDLYVSNARAVDAYLTELALISYL